MIPNPSREDLEALQLPDVLPVLPLQGTVVFPYIIVPLSVGTERSMLAVDQALATDRLMMLISQIDPTREDPSPDDLHRVGTVSKIIRMLKLPDGRIRILVQGLLRARIETLSQVDPFLRARIERLESRRGDAEDLACEALVRSIRDHLERALSLGKNLSPEVMVVAANLDDPGRLADLTASNLDLKIQDAQALLEMIDAVRRLKAVSEHLHREIDLLEIQHQISSNAREEIDRSQREYFLRHQLWAIQEELGESDEFAEEIAGCRRAAKERELTDEAFEELEKKIRRLERSHPDSAENTVIRTYLDWLTGLPWAHMSSENLDLENARRVLDKDHYGLQKVKERILEMLAVRKLNPDTKGPILCFVGPPASARPPSAARSLASSTAGSSAPRWAKCGTRQRSGATAGPMSVPCLGASCKASIVPAPPIPSSCSTRSTRSAPTIVVIHLPPSLRSSTPNRTEAFEITISAFPTIYHRPSSSPLQTCWIRSNQRSWTEWK